MGVHSGKDGVVKVGGVTVAKTQKWTINEDIALQDTSAQGEASETHITGQKKATGTIDCLIDTTDTTGQGVLTLGASVTLKLYPDGAASGASYWTGTVTVQTLATNSDRSNPNQRTFSWTANGDFAWETVS